MYTEEPKRSIDWGNVIKKGLLILAVAAVIFLIIWLFTRNNSNSINVDYGNESNNNSNVTETLENSNSYSEIFIDNYRYFHDTAKEYFLVSELPANGKTLKYTLQELIDKGLILPFSYGNSTCDNEASYVTVKNDNGEYTMTTTLVCGKEVAKTTIELGCNQLCTDNTCEPTKTTIEYQYKQAYTTTETVYDCDKYPGYLLNGTKCVKSDSETINATKKVTYNCDKYPGYALDGTKCVKLGNKTVNATKNVTYNCDKYPDYELSGTKCVKTTSSTDTKNATATYDCNKYPGYKINGTKCVKTTSSTDTKNATATTTYSCTQGDIVNTKYCRIYSTSSYYQSYVTYKGKTYNGCSYSGSYTEACSTYSGCTRTYYKYYCSKSSYKDVAAKATTTYDCNKYPGYKVDGTKCVKTTSSTDTKNATVTYNCDKYPGYKVDGTKCVKTTSSTDTKNATKVTTYNCDKYPGYLLNGTKCVKASNDIKNATKITTYNCPSKEYTKIGIGSSAKCTKGSTTTVAATKSTKTVTKYRYKWSTETSLEGWERTGETRTVSSK